MISQAIFVVFAGLAMLATALSVYVTIRSRVLNYKPLWIIGSMIGLVGLGIDWTSPDDLYLQFGLSVPFIWYSEVTGSGGILIKSLFPVVALVAIYRDRVGNPDEAEVFR